MFPRLFTASLAILSIAGAALAHDYRAGQLKISHPWAKPTLNGAPAGSGYLSITNTGKTADRLLSGSSPAAGSVEIHEMSMTGGIMRMRQITEGVAIAPGATVSLQPGGNHLMLIGLKRPLVSGQRIPATLVFRNAGKVQVELTVESPAPAATMPGMSMPGHMDH